MGQQLPSFTAKKLVRFFKKQGWREDRQKGSHLTPVNPSNQRTVTIPVHTGTDIGKGLLKKILAEAGYTVEEFNHLR